ncbi:alpha-N-acetylgalactosaminide alpha-2,6-sialyltransferase 3 isoform X4 [Pelodiscus sinensis]
MPFSHIQRRPLRTHYGYINVKTQEPLQLDCDLCAIVSNSGQMAGQKVGIEIDQSSCVWRMNNAPTKGYEEDVGKKTTIRVVSHTSVPLLLKNPEYFFKEANITIYVIWGPFRNMRKDGNGIVYNMLKKTVDSYPEAKIYVTTEKRMSYCDGVFKEETGKDRWSSTLGQRALTRAQRRRRRRMTTAMSCRSLEGACHSPRTPKPSQQPGHRCLLRPRRPRHVSAITVPLCRAGRGNPGTTHVGLADNGSCSNLCMCRASWGIWPRLAATQGPWPDTHMHVCMKAHDMLLTPGRDTAQCPPSRSPLYAEAGHSSPFPFPAPTLYTAQGHGCSPGPAHTPRDSRT